jgi:hypothetical protein
MLDDPEFVRRIAGAVATAKAVQRRCRALQGADTTNESDLYEAACGLAGKIRIDSVLCRRYMFWSHDMEAKERIRNYRVRKRAAGLRLLQLWVPDTRSPRFVEECRRQSRLLRGDAAEADALDFIERAGHWVDDAAR